MGWLGFQGENDDTYLCVSAHFCFELMGGLFIGSICIWWEYLDNSEGGCDEKKKKVDQLEGCAFVIVIVCYKIKLFFALIPRLVQLGV